MGIESSAGYRPDLGQSERAVDPEIMEESELNLAFAFIKPGFVERADEIKKMIEDSGLDIVYESPVCFTEADIEQMYEDSRDEHFFKTMQHYLSRHKSLALIIGCRDPKIQEILYRLKKTEEGKDGPIRKAFRKGPKLSDDDIEKWLDVEHEEQDKVTIALTQNNVFHVPDSNEESVKLIKRIFGDRFSWLQSRGCFPNEIQQFLENNEDTAIPA